MKSHQTLYVARSERVAARLIGGEMMIMSGLDSSLFNLNETASILWQSADGVTPLATLVRERICSEYEVDEAQALDDAIALVRQLEAHGLMRSSVAPIADEADSVP